jgi:hypothetical protein
VQGEIRVLNIHMYAYKYIYIYIYIYTHTHTHVQEPPKLFFNKADDMQGKVRVYVRCRPFINLERDASAQQAVTCVGNVSCQVSMLFVREIDVCVCGCVCVSEEERGRECVCE